MAHSRNVGKIAALNYETSSAEPRERLEALARLLYPLLDAGDPPPLTVTRKAVPPPGSAANASSPPDCDILTVEEASQLLGSVIGDVSFDGTKCTYQLGDPEGVARMLMVSKSCDGTPLAAASAVWPDAKEVEGVADSFVATIGGMAQGAGPERDGCRVNVTVFSDTDVDRIASEAIRLTVGR